MRALVKISGNAPNNALIYSGLDSSSVPLKVESFSLAFRNSWRTSDDVGTHCFDAGFEAMSSLIPYGTFPKQGDPNIDPKIL